MAEISLLKTIALRFKNDAMQMKVIILVKLTQILSQMIISLTALDNSICTVLRWI